MIKKNLVLMFACVSAIFGAAAEQQISPSPQALSPDSAVIIVSDSLSQINIISVESKAAEKVSVVNIDDTDYLISDGVAYKISEPDDTYDEDFIVNPDDVRTMTGSVRENVVPIIALIFGLPCAAVVIVVLLLVNYLLKKNRERNAIINKAIDANYQLPETFFNTSSRVTPIEGDASAGTKSNRFLTVQPISARDPKKFSSGISLIGVGLPLFLFFIISGHPGVAFLCGGILIFVGIAQLLSYYCLPVYMNDRSRRNNYQQMYPPYPQPPYDGRVSNVPSQEFHQYGQMPNNDAAMNRQQNDDTICPPPVR